MNGDILGQFLTDMEAAGIGPHNTISVKSDGKLHRYRVRGDGGGTLNGWYVLHADGLPAGAFGSWKHGIKEMWRPEGTPATADERSRAERIVKAAQEKARQEREQDQKRTAERVMVFWSSSEPARRDHPYLVRKRVQPHMARQSGELLLVPLWDFDGTLWNLQRIFANGDKRFMKGGRIAGLFCVFGDLANTGRLVICEGWATGATLHQTTGKPVLATMTAANLLEVCKVARAKWPDADMVVAADNDRFTRLPDGRHNPGVTYASIAAATIGARLAIPQFPSANRGTDFNDLHLLHAGIGAGR